MSVPNQPTHSLVVKTFYKDQPHDGTKEKSVGIVIRVHECLHKKSWQSIQ